MIETLLLIYITGVMVHLGLLGYWEKTYINQIRSPLKHIFVYNDGYIYLYPSIVCCFGWPVLTALILTFYFFYIPFFIGKKFR